MTSRDFCFWLQGYFELGGGSSGMLTQQVEEVKRHLALVFAHEIDPAVDKGDPQTKKKLDSIHSGGTMRC